jgi:FixJ family two-component response regulator
LNEDKDHNQAPDRPATVFVIDDDSAVRAAITLLVRACGWDAVPCESAEAFLGVYSPGEGQCLVLDHRMSGLTGVQLQRRLREQNDRVPVIMVTAHRDLPEADQAYLYGAYAVLGKPVDGTELEGWIRRALASH